MNMFWPLAKVALSVVVGVPLAVYFLQERMLFYPQPPGRPLDLPNVEAVSVRAADGATLRGWLVKAQTSPAPLVIYFGGNAEEVSTLASVAQRFGDWSLLLVNYRGYGGSEGKPSQRELFADALAIHQYAARRPDVMPERIVAMGRSLGTGVAVHLAAERPLRGVILVSPYDSVTELAKRHYPYLPVSLLLKHRFDSVSRAGGIEAPLLSLAGARDTLIPIEHSRRLCDAWRGPKSCREFAQADHDSLAEQDGYWSAIAGFLYERR